jgi:hypothetical protein
MALEQAKSKHSERLGLMLERIGDKLSEQELTDIRRAIQVIERIEQGQGFAASPAVSRDGVGRVDVSWMGMMANLPPELARQVGNALVENAALAEVESGLIKFMRDEMSLDMQQAGAVLAKFREYRTKPTDRPSLIVSPFGHN